MDRANRPPSAIERTTCSERMPTSSTPGCRFARANSKRRSNTPCSERCPTAPRTVGGGVCSDARRQIAPAQPHSATRAYRGRLPARRPGRPAPGRAALPRPDSKQYLAVETEGVPHLIGLPRLLNAAEELERDEPTSEDLRLLLHGGSSLGGARPKAHVLDTEGHLAIAKFPSPTADDWDVIRWEAVALDAGEGMPESQWPSTICTCREPPGTRGAPLRSRRWRGRIGYASAMTMLASQRRGAGKLSGNREVIEERSPDAGPTYESCGDGSSSRS